MRRNTAIDWSEIDPGMVELVRLLRANGIRTIYSCQGGDGHSKHGPYVDFQGTFLAVRKVLRLLFEWRPYPFKFRAVFVSHWWTVIDGDRYLEKLWRVQW